MDPAIFRHKTKAGRIERLGSIIKSFGGLFALGLLFGYPVILATIGVVYGGIAFWGFFLGSLAMIGFFVKKFGYAGNFEAWNPSLSRQVLGLLLAFLAAGGSYIGLVQLNLWMVPILFGVSGIGLVITLRRET